VTGPATHTGEPELQLIVPGWQGVLQSAPLRHATQLPLPSHTPLPLSQLVPGPRLPLSTQTGSPVVHAIFPAWHALASGQSAPALQGPQTPA